MLKMSLALVLCASSTAALAQGMLPANSEVPLVLDQEVSSKRMKVGDTFDVSVARDVWSGDRIAIPRGARGKGAVVWKTGKGAFGKSGKMEIELRSVEVAGQVVPLSGKYRHEGQGNTAATVGTIVAAGVIAGMFVTGHSAVFAPGTELRGLTAAPFAAAGSRPAPAMRVAQAPVSFAPAPMTAAPASFAPAPVAYAASYAMPSAVPAEDKSVRFAQLLRAQQGVRGRNTQQGWTISD